MNPALGFMIESLVAVLLLVTIGYCMLLNKRLQHCHQALDHKS